VLRRGLGLENCDCFGVFLARPLEWYAPIEDAALIAASCGLFDLSGGTRRAGTTVAVKGAAADDAMGVRAEG
jgi:hypothetical protein